MAEGGSGGSGAAPDTGHSSGGQPTAPNSTGLLPLSPPKSEVDESPLQKSMDKNKECKCASVNANNRVQMWVLLLRVTSVAIVTRLRAGRSRNWASILGSSKRFFLPQNIPTTSGTHPASYSMGTGRISPVRCKAVEAYS